MSSYSEKLRHPLWQRKRLEVFNRDGWKCKGCGETNLNLQVHHVEYLGLPNPWDYPDDMLVTLCEVCHGKEQKRPKHEEDLLNALKITGFNAFHVWNLATKIHIDQRFRIHLLNIISK